jgi:hypothetical protein
VTALQNVKAVLSAAAEVPEVVFERHSGFRPQSIAQQLADQLDAYARRESLGYYPALDFARERGAVDERLLAALDQLTWLATSLAGEELRARLRPVFASVQVRSMQALAYSMPQVRPGQADAAAQLARHLAANRVRFELLLTLLRRNADSQGLERYIGRATRRHLDEAFDTIDIANISVLE